MGAKFSRARRKVRGLARRARLAAIVGPALTDARLRRLAIRAALLGLPMTARFLARVAK
jgi:hypothetical protein